MAERIKNLFLMMKVRKHEELGHAGDEIFLAEDGLDAQITQGFAIGAPVQLVVEQAEKAVGESP